MKWYDNHIQNKMGADLEDMLILTKYKLYRVVLYLTQELKDLKGKKNFK